jgi:membrane protease YdiL (CAAX protease family)
MSTEFRMFHGVSRGATAFEVACVAFAAIAVSQVVDGYVLHELLRGSGFPAARLVAATTLGGALLSVPALRAKCCELLAAPPARPGGLELRAIALLLATLALSALGEERWDAVAAPAARGEVAAVVLVCAIEDIVLLGLLYPAWALHWGWERSLVAAAAVAAIAHADAVAQFMTVLLLGGVLRRTGSLLACVAVHAMATAAISSETAGRWLLRAHRIAGGADWWALHLTCAIVVGVATIAYLRAPRADVFAQR